MGLETKIKKIIDTSHEPITPKGRYLICQTPSNMRNIAREYAIIGFIE